jgi:hypothetical protein
VGEISSASSEQSAGVAQVGEAVTQMDKATQQNAALVEQMAAAATSLRTQAGDLVQTVAVFILGANEEVGRTTIRSLQPKSPSFVGGERRTMSAKSTKPSSTPVRPPKVRQVALSSSPAQASPVTGGDEQWETF